MKHDDVKKELLKNPEANIEYEKLQILYDIKREIIKLITTGYKDSNS